MSLPNFGIRPMDSQYTLPPPQIPQTVTQTVIDKPLEIVCFTPKPPLPATSAPKRDGMVSFVSLVKLPNLDVRKITTDKNLATLPANAIVESISYYGFKNFNTTGVFNIGIGQLNSNLTQFFINGGTSSIANEKQGGSRCFSTNNETGSNEMPFITSDSFINLEFEQPMTGGLTVVIKYYLKPINK